MRKQTTVIDITSLSKLEQVMRKAQRSLERIRNISKLEMSISMTDNTAEIIKSFNTENEAEVFKMPDDMKTEGVAAKAETKTLQETQNRFEATAMFEQLRSISSELNRMDWHRRIDTASNTELLSDRQSQVSSAFRSFETKTVTAAAEHTEKLNFYDKLRESHMSARDEISTAHSESIKQSQRDTADETNSFKSKTAEESRLISGFLSETTASSYDSTEQILNRTNSSKSTAMNFEKVIERIGTVVTDTASRVAPISEISNPTVFTPVTASGFNADGGILTRPHIGLVGEAEAIIPLSSSRRSRGMALWAQTGEMLGIKPAAPISFGGTGNSGDTLPIVRIENITISPDINIEKGTDETTIAKTIKNGILQATDEIAQRLVIRLGKCNANAQ
jgi:hypothetical protein